MNKFTHIEEDVFSVPEENGNTIVKSSLEALLNFFNAIDELRNNLIETYEKLLYEIIDDIFRNETFDDIDILSTHHIIEEIQLEQVKIKNISSELIFIEIFGTVDVEHQYGSARERDKDDGDVFSNSYPFTVVKEINVENPLNISITSEEIQVDNSNFFDDGEMEEEYDDSEVEEYLDTEQDF